MDFHLNQGINAIFATILLNSHSHFLFMCWIPETTNPLVVFASGTFELKYWSLGDDLELIPKYCIYTI